MHAAATDLENILPPMVSQSLCQSPPALPASLIGLKLSRLEEVMATLKQPKYRARQLITWMYHKTITDPELMTDIGQDFRHQIKTQFHWDVLSVESKHVSSDGSIKYLFRCRDGETIESVWMPQEDRYTVCVSSQVGCRMGCRFCNTSTMGLKRHLSSAEIVSQVLMIKKEHPVTNIVFMGMGEPFDNFDSMMESVELLLSNIAFNLSARKVTVSTSGVVPKIERFAKESRAQLAISLNGSTNETRHSLMPVNRKWPIEDIIKVVRDNFGHDRRRVTFEYILMSGVNDSLEDAHRIARLLRGLPCKVNLIPYNNNPFLPYKRPTDEVIYKFQEILAGHHYTAPIRWSKGQDIAAACGQLKTEVEKRASALLTPAIA